jgi:hypothetical protein
MRRKGSLKRGRSKGFSPKENLAKRGGETKANLKLHKETLALGRYAKSKRALLAKDY